MDSPNSLLRVAVVQYRSLMHVGSTTANLDRMADFVRQASAAGATIVVFSELGTCGYGITTEAVHNAVDCEAEVKQRLKQLSDQYEIRIVASYPSRGEQPADGKYYIAASLFAPDGSIEITYYKTHPWAASTFENQHFSLGHAFANSISLHPFSDHVHPDGRRPAPRPDQGDFSDVWLNILICWDIEFPEPARVIRLSTPGNHHNSPLILAIPTANADGDVAAYTLRARAAENHCFILYANQAGSDFCGGSSIVGPDGQVLSTVSGTEEAMIIADLDVGHERYEATRKMNPMLEWRRPELYGHIAEEERWEKPSWHAGKVVL